jgi:hypothetical protein
MSERALLTEREREILRGDADGEVERPDEYRSKIRGRVGKRINNLATDIEVLRDHEPELAERVADEICEPQGRLEELEARISELEQDNE